MNLRDMIGELIRAVVSSAGVPPPRMQPAKRPKTAIDRAKARRRTQRHYDLVAEVEAAQQRVAEASARHDVT